MHYIYTYNHIHTYSIYLQRIYCVCARVCTLCVKCVMILYTILHGCICKEYERKWKGDNDKRHVMSPILFCYTLKARPEACRPPLFLQSKWNWEIIELNELSKFPIGNEELQGLPFSASILGHHIIQLVCYALGIDRRFNAAAPKRK